MAYSNGLQVINLIRSLPKAWETKASVLEDKDLQKMTYDELWENLMAYEQYHINRYNKNDKKKTMEFMVEEFEVEEEVEENQDEGMDFINWGVRQSLDKEDRDLNRILRTKISKEMIIVATTIFWASGSSPFIYVHILDSDFSS